ncbi:nuclear transport factor 2 family protein [Polymorphum gilvum]|uniref:DUF4440 domain-containing protein n=1 Tax=Polymorphum gilvum (strain LMG 25793 / CGMCC 1.9160 / SL003B-26A1) TaxID=991905 RepID=F2IVD5_POLGS|nr:nuclear transport factor 2 family protein [Polymorphum gilvum]ADZ72653.1 hypothetical protein SL003B_4236 [Polymorphum gilvum SL003B-26A1]
MDLTALTPVQRSLWSRVEELWQLGIAQDPEPVRRALHPDYCGWVTGTDAPHDRAAAVASVGPGSPRILGHRLEPLAVSVFEDMVGVVHYRYEADVETTAGAGRSVTGRWSEVYLRRNGEWTMISVSGGPDGER